MPEGSSLINMGDISKPATVLIEKISNAVGGYFRPYQIRRVARAEADADIIKAQAHIEITDLQRRAILRFFGEEAQKQDNIEEITRKVLPLLQETSAPGNVEDDWIVNFFDKCRIISDQEMQSLWAKVLAGEANSPGTYSKRTVNFLSSLDNTDAQLFTSLCGFVWFVEEFVPLIINHNERIYNHQGINFDALTHLDDIRLVSFEAVAGLRDTGLPKQIMIRYYGTSLNVQFNKEAQNDLELGEVLLTKTGQQLVPICGSKPVEGFLDYIIDRWVKMGLILSSPYPRMPQTTG